MAGYNGYSMSNNAVGAYADGEKPLSKWTKKEILNAYEEICDENKLHFYDLSKVDLQTLKNFLLHQSSWHHTSLMFNETDFYSIDTSYCESLNVEMVEKLKNIKPLKKEVEKTSIETWEVEYLTWSGTRNHPKATQHTEIVERDYSKSYVNTTNGRKMINANGFSFLKKLEQPQSMLETIKSNSKKSEKLSISDTKEEYIMDWNNKKDALDAVKNYGSALEFASEELQADKEVVLEAVKSNSWALQFASEELQADKEVVLEAVKNGGGALEFVSEELRADKEVVLEAVKNNCSALEYASEELQADKEVVLEAVKNDGGILSYTSEILRADKELVLEAVKGCGWILGIVSEELRADKEIVLEAVKNYGSALQYASEGLQADKEVVLEAVKNDSWALHFASEELQQEICHWGGVENWIEKKTQQKELDTNNHLNRQGSYDDFCL